MRFPRLLGRVSLSLLGAAAALGPAACGGSTGSPPATPPTEGLRALSGAPTLDGAPFEADVLAGRDVVAWFWAPWCVICRAEAPDIADVAGRYGDRVTVVGVAGRGDVEDMAAFVADTGTAAITHVVDGDGSIWSSFGVYGQPAFAFIDDDGTVEVFIGSLGDEGLEERVTALLTT